MGASAPFSYLGINNSLNCTWNDLNDALTVN